MKAGILPFIIFGLGAVVGFSACNSSTDDESQGAITQAGSSTLVKSFSLRPNYKIMSNLDSVFFSIDQVKGEIFNADSLPWGTDVRKLTVTYSLATSGAVEIIMPSLKTGQDTVINLVQNPTDSINFSNGRVWMRVTSRDGEYERIYSVKVNVHNVNADSLQWNSHVSFLPTPLSRPTEAKAVECDGAYFLLAGDGSTTALTTTDNPERDNWSRVTTAGLPSDVKVNSLSASSDALYILSADGSLYTSADKGATWRAADSGWNHIYGGFAGEIVGVKGSQWISYPSGATGTIPAEMPVSGTSAMWTYTNDWAVEPQAMFVGGVKADGTYSGQCWGFDGNRWMQFSNQMGTRVLPAARGIQLFPYFTFRTGSAGFMVTRQSAWIAMGGLTADGKAQPKVYYSLDNGINWREAPQGMQLPKSISPKVDASVLLCDRTFTDSRAVRPITEWDAPYVYLLGGYTASGALFNQKWTGVLNRLTFKPLQ